MPRKVGFALLGCGNIAQKYCTAISKYLDDGEIIAVCDLDAAKAQGLGEQYGLPWFTNADLMMAQMGEKIDVINILTPSGYHCQNVLDLVAHGKHLCVEKPMALTLEDADMMIAACDKAGVQLFVVNQNRFNLPVQKLRLAIERGRLGKLVTGSVRLRWSRDQSYYSQASWRGTWALDGGVFANQTYHFIDLLQWLMGDVQSVFAKGATRRANIETEDTGVIIFQFGNGALGTVEATTATIPATQECSLMVLGDRGTVEIAGFSVDKMRLWQFTDPQVEDEEILLNGCQNPTDTKVFGHLSYLQSVVETINSGKPPAVDGRNGRKSLELVSAVYESMATGKEVQINGGYYPASRLGQQLVEV
jgi:UDP-N-acetyl-2-amino-2-deoxyglucuronate dehydrogenase